MRVGTLSYATQQGLGYLAKDFFDNGIITDPFIYRHSSPHRPTHTEWYPKNTPVITNIGAMRHKLYPHLRKLDAMLFFETPFDWNLLRACKQYKVRTILMPMYEWTPSQWPYKPDVLLCPSLLDYEYFKDQYRKEDCVFTPVPVTLEHWQLRTYAVKFLHNAGNVGYREHKGTRQLLQASKLVENPDFRLTVRAQDTASLSSIVNEAQPDDRVEIQYGEISYEELWRTHDAYVAPEKFNGLSLPLQEAYAAGMLVITTNRFPMNSWLPNEPLIPVREMQRARVSSRCYEFDECIVSPEDIAQTIDKWIGADITAYSENSRRWAEAHSWEVMKPFYENAIECAVKGIQCPSY